MLNYEKGGRKNRVKRRIIGEKAVTLQFETRV
jgi:hypothetical protein